MVTTRRSAARLGGLLLTIASLMQGSFPTGYAQASSGRTESTYFITGAVKNPGVYRIESDASVLKLLVLAGGLEDSHGPVAFIIRRVPAQAADQDPSYTVIQMRIDEVLKGHLHADVRLESGDIVNIPNADILFVMGGVVNPGSFPFKEGVTLMQAISAARGLKAGAQGAKAVILRKDRSAGKQEITVDLDAVTSGKQKDIPLLPNDIVVVPDSRAGNRLRRFLDAPPAPVLRRCRSARPCIARADLVVKPVSGKNRTVEWILGGTTGL
jgi:protein involved in polysaccharide export with SLBB domain